MANGNTPVSARDSTVIDAHLREFEKLKDEQISRIGFRDNLLYVTLGAVGAIMSFVLIDPPARQVALLVIPWVCVVLGWTYVANDQKTSAIGEYIRDILAPKIQKRAPDGDRPLLEWERVNQEDGGRFWRKAFQCLVNLVTFVLSGSGALAYFFRLASPLSLGLLFWFVLEAILLVALGVWIGTYSDIVRSWRSRSANRRTQSPRLPVSPAVPPPRQP